jgi:uncharacterized membrane protein YhaH (DUF805 family)
VTTGDIFIATLVQYMLSQLPALIALVVAIVLVVVHRPRDRRRAATGIGAFVLALLCTVIWPVVVATTAWLPTQGHAMAGSVLNGAADFVLRALTGLAWLLVVVALFPGRTASTR